MVRVEEVTLIFNPGTASENAALKKVSLDVEEGEFVTLIGSNGAGKTTLFNVIAGAFNPTGGRVYIGGKDVTKTPEYRRARLIGRIFQNPLLGTAGSMSIEQNMALCCKKGFRGLRLALSHVRREEYKRELAKLNMGLEDRLKDSVGLLSGGQRQALTLLTTVLSRPSLLLLDEHTAALDPGNADRVMALTRELVAEQGVTTLMITHNMQQAIDYGSRLLMMDKGRIIADILGEEKKELTVGKLVDKFRNLHMDMMNTDEVLLADEK